MSLSLRLFSRKQFLAVQIAPSQLVFQAMKLDHKQVWLKSVNKPSARLIFRCEEMSMKRFCDISRPSSRHRFLLPQTPDDLLFREACSSWAPSGFFPQRPVDHPLEPLYPSRSNSGKDRPAARTAPHRNLRRSFAAGVNA